MNDTITLEEEFEHSLRSFLEWLEVMTLESIELCNTWGNYNVAWELTTDLKRDGDCIVRLGCSYLSDFQKESVKHFINSLNVIPENVLVFDATVEGNQQKMSNPCWVPYKKSALELLTILKTAADKNREYFAS